MCGCTSRNPAECECGVNGPCLCSCHRNWQQGPRTPLDDLHQMVHSQRLEITRLQARIVLLEAVQSAAQRYLATTIPANANRLHEALRQARDEE